MNHKRKEPKNSRAVCLMRKPNKMNGWNKRRDLIMCKKCVLSVKKYFPLLDRDDYGHLLISATCFPDGSHKLVDSQLKEASENSDGTLGGAIAYAEAELDKAMAERDKANAG